jgi:hypothetical protein
MKSYPDGQALYLHCRRPCARVAVVDSIVTVVQTVRRRMTWVVAKAATINAAGRLQHNNCVWSQDYGAYTAAFSFVPMQIEVDVLITYQIRNDGLYV